MSENLVITQAELHDAWPVLSPEERRDGFRLLPTAAAEQLFVALDPDDQWELLDEMDAEEQRPWVRLLPPDDMVDLIQHVPREAQREALLALLDESSRRRTTALQRYAEDSAGGLMNPHYYRLDPDMSVEEAVIYLRNQIQEPIHAAQFAYVLDNQQHLLGVVPFRDLIRSAPAQRVSEIMDQRVISVPEQLDQEQVGRLFSQHDLVALPVVDADGQMKGVVTADDILDVLQEEATEDAHKAGGMGVLSRPYLQIPVPTMIRKRVGWLTVLFLGETFTATVMAFFEQELRQAVVLSLFIPLIVSSGGNSGSQASTLIIRAMALGHVRLRDWFRVIRRELSTGLTLGVVLAAIAFVRILAWEAVHQRIEHTPLYGEHYFLVALTVSLSLIGVVLWGCLAGSLLPFVLRALRFDPASVSAPFVATLVDVTGLLIYFGFANIVLRGTLL